MDLNQISTEEIEPLADSTAVQVVPSKDPKKEKLRIWKNVILASISFMITFMAYASLQDIQSSLNTVDGLGVASISIIYACAIITGLFFTPLIVRKAGCKKSLVIFTFCYAGFAAANFHPTWYTMVPVSVIAGRGFILIRELFDMAYLGKRCHVDCCKTAVLELINQHSPVNLNKNFGKIYPNCSSYPTHFNSILSILLVDPPNHSLFT